MAAGLGFKTFTTGEVLTAADTNGYLMQGVLVFASSAARASAITSPQEGQYSYLKDTDALEYYSGSAWVGAPVGDITGVTAGTGISGGGTSGTVTVTNSMATAITTNGDVIYGTGSGTFTRLGIGSSAQVLTVAGGIPSWASPSSGALTLVSTTTLSASGSFNITSCFSATYDDYLIFIDEIVGSTGSYFNYGLRTGSSNSTASYKYVNYGYTYAGSNASSNSTGDSSMGALDWTTTDADAGSLFITLRGPFLAKATQSSIQKSQNAGASMQNGLHAVATSYESMFFTVNSGTISGKIRIYGLAK